MKNIAYQLAELCSRKLTEAEMTMLELLCDAHEAAARANPNASNQMAAYMGQAGVDLKSAYIGALSIIGGKHAPVTEIREFLRSHFAGRESRFYGTGGTIPGWGNSFYKEGIDPAAQAIAKFIERNRLDWHDTINGVTKWLHDNDRKVYPNIGCYTAVVAEIINFPNGAELALVVLPRLTTWTKLYLEAKNK